MDHFENVIRLLLEREGYWVVSSFKVNLTKEEKRETGKHSIPRPEIDLLAYKPASNEVLAIECKSFLDSTGVDPGSLKTETEVADGKYKLFTAPRYRNLVFNRLQRDLVDCGLLDREVPIRLGLAAGKVKTKKDQELSQLMRDRNWFYWSPADIRRRIESLASRGYENEALYIVAKILLRE